MLSKGGCANDGKEIISQVIRNISQVDSVCGSTMLIDENGDVLGNYTVFAYKDYKEVKDYVADENQLDFRKHFIPIANFKYNRTFSDNTTKFNGTLTYESIKGRGVDWISGEQPTDVPKCGFDNSLCKTGDDLTKKLFGVLIVIVVIMVFSTIFIYRNYRHEQEIQGLLWNIKLPNKDYDDDSLSSYADSKCYPDTSNYASPNLPSKRTFTRTTEFNGRMVAVKRLRFPGHKFELSIDVKKEMSVIKNLHHDNIAQFIGADLENLSSANQIYLVTEYCEKGSLLDILAEEKFPLGTIITASFIFDLLSALSYLHKSEIKFHGNLKSSNCLVTNRIILKSKYYYEVVFGKEQNENLRI